jgi:hypothetical protein
MGSHGETPGRAHSSRLYTGVRNPPWGTGCGPTGTGTARRFAAPLSELRDLVGWGVRVTATQLVGHKGVHPSRGRLTGDPLGVSRRTVGARMMAEDAARRNLSCTGKPRGLREISARTRGGDQANRLNQPRLPSGYLLPGGVAEGQRHRYEGRKPGPDPWGLPPSGPALAPPGGGPRGSRLFPESGT